MDLFYKGTAKQRFIDRAVNLALFLGFWLPVIVLVANLFDFMNKFAGMYYLLDFSGFFGQLLAGIESKYTFIEILFQSVSLITVLTAILFRITRIPLFAFFLIVDAIAGYAQSMKTIESYLAFRGSPLLDLTKTSPLFVNLLPLIETVLMIAIVIVYLLGLAGSCLFFVDFMAYKKQKTFIQGHLPAGTDADILIQNMQIGKSSFEFRVTRKDSLCGSVNGFARTGKVKTGSKVQLMDGNGRILAETTIAKVIFADKKETVDTVQPGAEFTLFLPGVSRESLQNVFSIAAEST
jgi:hypothetical protein